MPSNGGKPDGNAYVGRLELGGRALRLVGDGCGRAGDRQIGYDELEALRIGSRRSPRARHRTPARAYHVTSTVFEAAILQELAERLSELRLAAP
jgi:hypothetical protein